MTIRRLRSLLDVDGIAAQMDGIHTADLGTFHFMQLVVFIHTQLLRRIAVAVHGHFGFG